MKTPELSVLRSETIALELAHSQLALSPSGEDLAALSDRLGVKTPKALTAALVHPGDRVLFPDAETTEDPAKADVASVSMDDLSVFPDTPMRVTIRELSEQEILESFAHSLMVRGRFHRRLNVAKWGAAAIGAELGGGTIASIVQGPGLNWGLLGIPLAMITSGCLWLWSRGWRYEPVAVPSLRGLSSPIRITEQQERS